MEVYVHEIILNSRKVDMLPHVMRETFVKILHVGLKLNQRSVYLVCWQENVWVHCIRKGHRNRP